MNCYYVFVHGRLNWLAPRETAGPHADNPKGFYCWRYVFASNNWIASEKAFAKVRANLDHKTGWLRLGQALLHLEVEEIYRAPIYNLLMPDNRGHTFYIED